MRSFAALFIAAFVATAAGCSGSAGAPGTSPEPALTTPPVERGPIEPGRYAFAAVGGGAAGLPRTAVDVPEGFVADERFLLLASSDDPASPAPDHDFTAFTVWAVQGVYRDGCHDLDSPRIVAARSAAQVAQVLHHAAGMHVAAPVRSTIAGHEALYVEFTTTRLDYERCNGGSYAFFEAGEGTAHVEGAGMLERWWILDLEGVPVIVGTAAGPGATSAQAAAIETLAQSAEFVSP